MSPKLAKGDDSSIKFGINIEIKEMFIEACRKVGMPQAQVLKQMVEAWIEEVESEDLKDESAEDKGEVGVAVSSTDQ